MYVYCHANVCLMYALKSFIQDLYHDAGMLP